MDQRTDLPTKEAIHARLQELAPGSTALAIEPLPGSHSNFTHLVNARAADGSDFRIAVRRYKAFGSYDRGEKARREFKTFELLQRNGIPSPQPLYLDEEGPALGIPGIVTSYDRHTGRIAFRSYPLGTRACGDACQNPFDSLRHSGL